MADTFRIDIVASPRQAQAGIQAVETELERLNRTAESTNSLLQTALRVTGFASGVVLLRRLTDGIRDYSDSYTQLQNQLSVVTKGTDQLNQVTEQLLGVADRSRVGFEATAKLYARTALATRELGTSQADLLGITETVSKAILLSGASAKESSNGLIQLSQAISSNRLAGDELRSVLEQLPVVADVIAKQLGVTRGELRALGKDGKITAAVILDGFKNARVEIEQRFAKTVPTISQAFTILENNAIAVVGQLNKASGASVAFAAALGLLAQNLRNLLFIGAAVGAVFAGIRLAGFINGLLEAVRVQKLFNAEIAAGLAGPEAAALALENEARAAVVLAQAKEAEIRATIASIEATRTSALIAADAGGAAVAQAEAELAVAGAIAQRARAAVLAAEIEAARLAVSDDELGATVALTRSTAALAEAEGVLSVAQARVVATTTAATEAEIAQAAITGRLAALQLELAAASETSAAAVATLNKPLAATPGLLGQIRAALAASGLGVAGALFLALGATLVDFKELAATIGAGLQSLAQGFFAIVGGIREAITGTATLTGTMQSLLRLLIAAVAGLVAFRIAAVSAGTAFALGLGAALIVIGEMSRALDEMNQKLIEQGNAIAQGDLVHQILRARQEVERLQDAVASGFGGDTAAQKLIDATAKLARLEKERLRDIQARKDAAADPFQIEIAGLQEVIRLQGLDRRERELELELIRRRKALLKEGVDLSKPQEDQLRATLRAKQGAEDLAAAIDDIKAPEDDFRRQFALLTKAEEEGRIGAEQLSGALNKLFEERRANNPLVVDLRDLRAELKNLSRDVPGLLQGAVNGPIQQPEGPAAQLKALQDANREREVQAQLEARLNAERAKGTSTQAILAARPEIEATIRQIAEEQRLNQLTEQRLELQRDLADQASLALLPQFEQGVQSSILALRELNLTAEDQAAREGEIRRNAALTELGGILNGLQSPLLAQAQAQQNVADQQERVNQLFRDGLPDVQQYSLALEELDFRAQSVSTSFTDGFSVALQEMQASLNDAAIGQQAFTSAINAAGAAASQFAQTGTVDFRQLALGVIAEITKMITQLLALKAIESLTGLGGGVPTTATGGSLVPFTGLGGRAEGGAVRSNQPVVVGEQGTPELFVPGRSGTILNSDQVSDALARAGGGRSGQTVVSAPDVHVSVHNTFDPSIVIDAMDTPAGARVVENHIASNPSSIKRSLGA